MPQIVSQRVVRASTVHVMCARVSASTFGGAHAHAHAHAAPISAVGTESGTLELYNEQGDTLATVPGLGIATCLAWHPQTANHVHGHLCVGTQSGAVIILRVPSGSTGPIVGELARTEDRAAHAAPICLVRWSPDGTRLVTGDQAGVIVLWRADPSVRVTVCASARKSGLPSEAAFLSWPGMALVAAASGESVAPAPAPAEADTDASESHIVPPLSAGGTAVLVSGDSGVVTYLNDAGFSSDIISSLHSAVDVLEYHQESRRIVVISRSLMMLHLTVNSAEGRISTVLRTKVSMKGTAGVQSKCWAGGSTLITSTPEEPILRCWDLLRDDNYTLSSSPSGSLPRHERISCLSFNAARATLAAGTESGVVYTWRQHQRKAESSSRGSWEPLAAVSLPAPVVSVEFGGRDGLILVRLANDEVYLLVEASMRRKLLNNLAAIQLSSTEVAVEKRSAPSAAPAMSLVKSAMTIKGMDCSVKHVLVWSGKACEVYIIGDAPAPPPGEISGAMLPMTLKQVSGFKVNSPEMAIAGDSVFACEDNCVTVRNLQGTVKHTLTFAEADGMPILLDSTGKYLAIATSGGRIRVYDVSRAEPRQLASGRFENPATAELLGEITNVRVNADGSRVALLSSKSVGAAGTAAADAHTPDTRVFVYGCESDRISQFEVGPKRYPVFVCWDAEEPRLLAVETARLRVSSSDSAPVAEASASTEGGDDFSKLDDANALKLDVDAMEEPDVEAITLFATADGEGGADLIQQDSTPIDAPHDALLGIAVPYLHLLLRIDSVPAGMTRIVQKSLRDFVGLEDADAATRKALIDFSYFMATGNMDEAYKAVKLIANPHVWENMAQMCVKSKRLDVAVVCLGHMGHARGAKAVREHAAEPQLEANVAQVAIQLGLLGDAARLYQGSARYDLLNELYQHCGQWDRALAVATRHDRLHLRSTHFSYARHLESVGDAAAAMKHYEAAGTHRVDVTRMLHEAGDLKSLEAYVNTQNDKALFKWFGDYMQARGELAAAATYFQRANDTLSLVRVACTAGEVGRAVDIVNETNDAAAAYFLAQQLEAGGHTREALSYYERSGRYNHAVRLAKDTGSDSDLLTMALQAPRRVMLEIAQHFESRGQLGRAVQLYHKAGAINRAIDMCFTGSLYEDLRVIADELGEKTSPELLHRCAEFFTSHGQFDKAVSLLIKAKRYSNAIEMCATKKVTITEAMAEALTPPKPESEETDTSPAATAAANERKELLLQLAKVCKHQGQFHLATKKYAQAGEKVKAMKCLLKSGDTEKIVFFANVSRSRDIYILAANYLQTLPWYSNAEILQHIIDFYTKAKAYEQLSTFFEACAAVEIDEYRNYEKALAAYREALKNAQKIKTDIRDARVASLNARVAIVERFVSARKLAKTDTAAMVEQCKALLTVRDAEPAIRLGDVYALLIYYFAQQKQWQQAYSFVEDMRTRSIALDPFLESSLLEEIYRSVGVDPVAAGLLRPAAAAEEEVGEDIHEEIDEDVPEAPAAAPARRR